MGFVKIHDALLDSSIMDESVGVRWVWICMLASTGPDGIVRGTPKTMARRFNVTEDELIEALAILMAPDPVSTSQDEDGRRVVRASPNRWQIVNYAFYRKLRAYEDRREYQRDYQREYQRSRRAAIKANQSLGVEQASNNGKQVEPIAEAEAEAEAENTCPTKIGFEHFWLVYPRKTNRKRAVTAWRNLSNADRDLARTALPDHVAYWRTTKRPTDKIPHASTWLNGECWNDELPHASTWVGPATTHPWHPDDVTRHGQPGSEHARWFEYMDAHEEAAEWPRFDEWMEGK